MTQKSTKLSDNLTFIGLICRVVRVKKMSDHIYLWMYRAIAMEEELAKHGYKIFCYTPVDVNPENMTAKGYVYNDGEFQQLTSPIPKINYDWNIGPVNLDGKPGFEYPDFEPWAVKQGYEIYPTRAFKRLAGDKFASYQAIIECDKNIAPYTQLLDDISPQLELFLQNSDTVFIKPRFGRMGNDIFVVKKNKGLYSVYHYMEGIKSNHQFESLPEVSLYLDTKTAEGQYIIQNGVKSLRYNNSAYDIRVIMLNDGDTWHALSEARVGAKNSDLSNISQGGRNHEQIEILERSLPHSRVEPILERIESMSTKLATFFTRESSNQLNEFAIDFLIDESENIYIAEINAKPGLSGMPDLFDNFLDRSEHEEQVYQNLTLQHGKYLSQFLMKKCPK